MPLKDKKGIMLIACYLVVVVLLVLGSALLLRSVGESKSAQRERASVQAFYLAEAGIDRVVSELHTTFQNNFPNPIPQDFNWFDGLDDLPRSENPPYAGPPGANTPLGEGTYTVIITAVSVDAQNGQADVTLESTGDSYFIQRRIRSTIRYQLAPSQVFNYSYFVNNLGWLWGGGITANGDIRSNGNFSFGGNPEVNGDIYASANPDLGANGDITGNSKNVTIPQYRNQADDEARPTDPTADPEDVNGNGILDPGEDTNGNGILDDFDYPNGYDGTSTRFPHQEVLEMPYLGNLQTYKDLAVAEAGTVTQGGAVLVNGVYHANGVGPDGIAGTPDDGCVVLNGTAANPIDIDGPVVVQGDVIIRGVVRGQGIIYSDRNTHIVGDITYENPPAWPKPDTDPETTDTINDARDFLGLAAKGNVVVGDYTSTSWQHVTNYLEPPFTQAYNVDPEDENIGYITGYDAEGNPFFDGDYTNTFGVKDDGAGGAEPRTYYDSSLSDDYIHSIAAASNQIHQVDAVTYTNHAFTGRVGEFTVNGTVVARDEAIIYSGHITMNYDLRAKTRGDDFHLPRQLALPETISWEEN